MSLAVQGLFRPQRDLILLVIENLKALGYCQWKRRSPLTRPGLRLSACVCGSRGQLEESSKVPGRLHAHDEALQFFALLLADDIAAQSEFFDQRHRGGLRRKETVRTAFERAASGQARLDHTTRARLLFENRAVGAGARQVIGRG